MPFNRLGTIPNSDKVSIPSGYNLAGLVLVTHNGIRLDIQSIVNKFTITESIYGLGLIFRCEVQDSVNLIEEYKLIGQERIEVYLSKTPSFAEQGDEVSLEFIVSEYPLYGKDLVQQNTQMYVIVGLSEHVFKSKLLRISRALTSENSVEIKRILSKDLVVDPRRLGTFDITSSTFSGIIPFSEPLRAASWLTANSFTGSGIPFFLFENLAGIHFRSYRNLTSGPVYETYDDSKLFTHSAFTKEDYLQRKKRITTLVSDYRISKVVSAIAGSYASETTFVDIGRKRINSEIFSGTSVDNSVTLNGNPLCSAEWKISSDASGTQRSLFEIPEAHYKFLPADDLNKTYNTRFRSKKYGTGNALTSGLDNYVHTLTLPGDLKLNAGSVIQLNILKAVDMASLNDNDEIYDSLLSGKYLVTSVVHNFAEEHICSVTVKKDSFTQSIS
jgi:hypothetical protein